jgi:sirohydrochlorin ferrochelatase
MARLNAAGPIRTQAETNMNPRDNPAVPTSRCERTAVLLIAHGSRESSANDDLIDLASRLAASGEHLIVEACFLELADPDIPTGGRHCVARGATCVLMIPYFLSSGVHLRRDLTAARDELMRRYPDVDFRLGSPLGPHPLLDSLVLARVRELDGTVSGSRTDPLPAMVDSVAPRHRVERSAGPSAVEAVRWRRQHRIQIDPQCAQEIASSPEFLPEEC